MQDYGDMLGWGNMLRSAEMEYISVIMQEHLSHECVEKLGAIGVVQFTDLNGDLTAFKRFYTPYIRRCDELEKKLKLFDEEMFKHGIEVDEVSPGAFAVWKQGQLDSITRDHAGLSLLDYWEAIIAERHRDYLAIKSERDRTASALYHAAQRRFVIERASGFFLEELAAGGPGGEEGGAGVGLGRDVEAGAGASSESDMTFKHVAGMLDTAEKVRFARIVFRASSGHAVVRFSDIPGEIVDDKGVAQVKSVFAIFYRGRSLTSKLDRICAAFSASTHDIPNFASPAQVEGALEETKRVIADSLTWLEHERGTTASTLAHMALLVLKWRTGVQREKAIYHTLNCFTRNFERGSVSAQGWVLATAVDTVKEVIKGVHTAAAAGGRVQPFYFEVQRGSALPKPPTHFHTNKFTRAFQGFVNTYGVPRYREANPALFAIVTFPFLFGVMFGDIGHSSLLFLFSLWVVLNEVGLGSKPQHEMFVMIFKGRYMLLLMSLFGIYCGGIYNDAFSLGTTAFKSAWSYAPGNRVATWSGKAADVYPFGIDTAWHNSENDLLYFNSLKMKMSVILGISQMTFGLVLKLSNAVYFKAWVDLWLEVVPQLIFMVALFGYMILLIVLKWSIDWNDPASRPGPPPSLIDTLINIALKPGFVGDKMYAGQAGVQLVILGIVFLCVPVMLLGKPYAINRAQNAAKAAKAAHGASKEEKSSLLQDGSGIAGAGTGLTTAGTAVIGGAVEVAVTSSSVSHAEAHGEGHEGGHDGGHGGGHEEHAIGEVIIHQAIETIEFVLGSVSNTASYLRLWALSLAHSQLATVFWERALVATIQMNSTMYVVVGYAAFAGISGGVLLCMDVLECFLHALRLHWVEFQNKFYKADGYKFTPFSFAAIAEAAKEEASK